MTTPIPTPRLVTVFGGSGFLGRHIVRALAKDGWRIRVAIRRPNLALFLRPMGRVGQIQLLKCNVNDEAQVRTALEGAEACVNLIGVIAPGGSQSFAAMHVGAADRIARLAQEMGVERLVHVSALGANGEAEAQYYQTKAEGERVVRAAFPRASILRPSLVFGPEDDFFNRFAMLARISPVLPLIGGGHTRSQPVFVGDVALAVSAILKDPATAGRTFEAAGPEVFTFKQLMQVVLRETQRRRLLVPIPFSGAMVNGFFLGLLPKPMLTMDQVRMLKSDTIAQSGEHGLSALGITPTAMEAIVPSYLWRFRKQGQFEPVAS